MLWLRCDHAVRPPLCVPPKHHTSLEDIDTELLSTDWLVAMSVGHFIDGNYCRRVQLIMGSTPPRQVS